MTEDDIPLIRTRRFLIYPLHQHNHWCLGIYDQAHHDAYFFDSFLGGSPARCIRWAEELLEDWLKEQGISVPTRKALTIQSVQITTQRAYWECGLFLLENARVFLREQHLHRTEPAIDWADSEVYKGREGSDPQDLIWELWITMIRKEIGNGTALRTPEAPQINDTQEDWISGVPNSIIAAEGPRAKAEYSDRISKMNAKVDPDELKEIPNPRKDIFNQLLKDRANNKTEVHQRGQGTLFTNVKGDLIEEEMKALSNRVSSVDLGGSRVPSHGSSSGGSISEYYTRMSNRAISPSRLLISRGQPSNDQRKWIPAGPQVPQPDDKPPIEKRPTYDHRLEPNAHLSPSHKAGWIGWANYKREQGLIIRETHPDLAQKKEEQNRARDLRAQQRQGSGAMEAPVLSPIPQSPQSSIARSDHSRNPSQPPQNPDRREESLPTRGGRAQQGRGGRYPSEPTRFSERLRKRHREP